VRNPYLLESSVETLDAALAAQRGGAHRIELCSDLAQGGLTPATALMRDVRERVTLPIFAMVRPRGGDFVYSGAEFATMERNIETAKQVGMDGVVLGILKRNGHIDIERTKQLVGLAQPLPVTFHRAFDASADLRKSLEDVIQTGAARILTSGGAKTAPEGLATLAELVDAACDRIIVVPGSGIVASNVLGIAERTHACEFHAGLSTVVRTADGQRNGFEAEVRKLVELLTTAS
jgi:copper homeostasis protein